MRATCLALLLALTGCTYDLFDDAYAVDDFRIGEVTGVFTGERTFAAPGQPARSVPATATITDEGNGTAVVRIEFDGLVEEIVGSYSPSGFYADGEAVDGSYAFNWYADGDGFISGGAYAPTPENRRVYTGRLTRDHFDLLVRSQDGAVRDDLRTRR